MAMITITTTVNIYTNDNEDGETVFAIVKDKALEARAAIQLLHMSGGTEMYGEPEIALTIEDAEGRRTLDLDELVHSEEEQANEE